MKNNTSSLDVKMDVISSPSTADIKKEASVNNDMTEKRLTRLFKGSAITEKKVLDLVSVIFVLEVLIYREKMRDFRLTDLEKKEVENLAIELYLIIEEMRNEIEGHIDLSGDTNKIIDNQLSDMLHDPEFQRYLEFKGTKTLWSWSSFDTDEAKMATEKAITLFGSISSFEKEVLDRVIKCGSLYGDLDAIEKQLKELAESSVNKAIEDGETVPDPEHMNRIFTCIHRNDEDEFLQEFGFLNSYNIIEIFDNHKIDNLIMIGQELGLPVPCVYESTSTPSGW